MQCPRCVSPLRATNRQDVEIDYCEQCHGIWLDGGELEKIIERAGDTTQGNHGVDGSSLLDVLDIFSG